MLPPSPSVSGSLGAQWGSQCCHGMLGRMWMLSRCFPCSLTPRGAASLWIWPIYLQESGLRVSLGISSCCLIMQGSVLPHLISLLNGGFALN